MTEKDQPNAEAVEQPEAADQPDAVADEAPGDAAADDPAAVLQRENDELKVELEAQRDRVLRLAAEMDNLRKRTRREVLDSRRFAQADVLRPLLEILDNFDRALNHAAETVGEGEGEDADIDQGARDAFAQGVTLIAQSFRQMLRDQGVQPIEAEGKPFDPSLHEAVGRQPAPEGVETDTVLAEVQAGYTLDDFVLRPSRVIVAQ
jgi:molecular chaperone GrpE